MLHCHDPLSLPMAAIIRAMHDAGGMRMMNIVDESVEHGFCGQLKGKVGREEELLLNVAWRLSSIEKRGCDASHCGEIPSRSLATRAG
jgi:hypothetical protein